MADEIADGDWPFLIGDGRFTVAYAAQLLAGVVPGSPGSRQGVARVRASTIAKLILANISTFGVTEAIVVAVAAPSAWSVPLERAMRMPSPARTVTRWVTLAGLRQGWALLPAAAVLPTPALLVWLNGKERMARPPSSQGAESRRDRELGEEMAVLCLLEVVRSLLDQSATAIAKKYVDRKMPGLGRSAVAKLFKEANEAVAAASAGNADPGGLTDRKRRPRLALLQELRAVSGATDATIVKRFEELTAASAEAAGVSELLLAAPGALEAVAKAAGGSISTELPPWVPAGAALSPPARRNKSAR